MCCGDLGDATGPVAAVSDRLLKLPIQKDHRAVHDLPSERHVLSAIGIRNRSKASGAQLGCCGIGGQCTIRRRISTAHRRVVAVAVVTPRSSERICTICKTRSTRYEKNSLACASRGKRSPDGRAVADLAVADFDTGIGTF